MKQAKYRISKGRDGWVLDGWNYYDEEVISEPSWNFVGTFDSKEEAEAYIQEIIHPNGFLYDSKGGPL